MSTASYKAGDCFAVPLIGGGFGLVLVARRMAQGPVLLAYLFGPKYLGLPSLQAVQRLRREDALSAVRVGDTGILEGRWALLGALSSYRRSDWPIPRFRSVDLARGATFEVTFAEDLVTPADRRSAGPNTHLLGSDGVHNARLVEEILSNRLQPDRIAAVNARSEALASMANRAVRHTLSVATEGGAAKIAKYFGGRGMDMEVEQVSASHTWLVHARHTVREDAEIESATRALRALGEVIGARYEGVSGTASTIEIAGDAPVDAQRKIAHYIYLSERKKADELAERLRREQFTVVVRRGADGMNWLVLAKHELVTDAEIQKTADRLEDVATSCGAEYDGWEAEEASPCLH